MFQLTGRRALVTGASGGIGGATARLLCAQGATVCVAGRNRSALDGLAAELGDRAHAVQSDLSESEGADRTLASAEDAMGGVDILVNNAGLARDGLAMRVRDDDWREVLEVNLTAAFRLSRGVLRGMMRARWGRIVNVTSIVGTTGNPGQTGYAASKAGIAGMSKSLAAEVASRGITVNCVAPGFIETAMTAGVDDARREELFRRIPAGRPGTPEDVAACVAFLCSGEAAYVTGQTLHVNGGMAMI